MTEICPQEQCTACSACMNICPKDAISMEEKGALGYIYPAINSDLCIDCHLCEQTCPVIHPTELHKPLKAYAAISKDELDLMSSASGGASSVLAQHILSKGGAVYGCIQENYQHITHQRITETTEAYRLKGSKYVQSHIGYIYRQVKQDLESCKLVLFAGTPCQIAGLRKYLKNEYDNLYLVDLVCHGVPSQRLLRDNVEEMVGKEGEKPYVIFRKKGTKPQDLRYGIFLNENNTIPLKKQLIPYNDYITAFMCGITFRENCYHCTYAQSRRGSDITIADFWGLGESEVPKGSGVSLMMPNTVKGERLITYAAEKLCLEERSVEEAVNGNGQLQHPSVRPSCRDAFMEMYAIDKRGAYKKYLSDYRKTYAKRMFVLKLVHIIHHFPFLYNSLRTIYRKFKNR